MANYRTAQEIFDVSTLALLKQGKAAMSSDGTCSYRTREGTKCAVGHLIPDALYSKDMEGSIITEDNLELLEAASINVRDWLLAAELQNAHDGTLCDRGTDAWKAQVRDIATAHSLSTKVLDDFERGDGGTTVASPYLLDLIA